MVVNGQERWFVPRLPQPLPIPPGGPKVLKPPPYEIPYTLSRSSPKGILESRIQPSVDDLHQTLFSVELTNGNLTVPQGVNITAQEHFDIAQTGAYKVVAESYILEGKVVTRFCGLIRIGDVGTRLSALDDTALWNIDWTGIAHQEGFNSASAHKESDVSLEERVQREIEIRSQRFGRHLVNGTGRVVPKHEAVTNGQARALVDYYTRVRGQDAGR